MINCFQVSFQIQLAALLRGGRGDARGAQGDEQGERRGHRQRDHGGAVQVDPMKPTLKAPGSKRLNL